MEYSVSDTITLFLYFSQILLMGSELDDSWDGMLPLLPLED